MIFKRKLFKILKLCLIYNGLIAFVLAKSTYPVTAAMNNVISYPPPTISVNNELMEEETPEGYYPFVQSAKMEPPRVKLPPYKISNKPCQGIEKRISSTDPGRRSLYNLCGDLNKGVVPANPMFQNVYGTPYPFALIKNKTLQFFSKTLPILKSDDTIPRIAMLQNEPDYYLHRHPPSSPTNIKRTFLHRVKRNANSSTYDNTSNENRKINNNFIKLLEMVANITKRQSRKFCDNDTGLLCTMYRLLQGQMFRSLTAQKRHDNPQLEYRTSMESSIPPIMDGPPTPCPAKVEYATPVYARNYQGSWRYVVQIPYEGYFTQTIEVTKCINLKCHYMEGGCLSSPRWVSLLVAEIYYPDSPGPITRQPSGNRHPVLNDEPPPIHDFQNYQQYLHKRAVPPTSSPESKNTNNIKRSHCDGIDEFGCFQVRLYFDWFLVPGSCKCWRPDYFSKYTRWSRESSYEL